MLRLCYLIMVLYLSPLFAAESLQNRLQDHPSPYLAMHGDDPVLWQDWGEAAFQRAAQEKKLIFVSSGYFSCHWCHVMQRESYRDPVIAAYINKHFIPVKIDRELLPDVDAGLIDFAEQTRGQAGWPLNVFVTPQGHPLIATLYLPPETFKTFLKDLTERWQQQAEGLSLMAASAARVEETEAPAADAEPVGNRLWSALYIQTLGLADELDGGFGAQSKFPMAPQLLTLLAAHEREADARMQAFLTTTLRQMADQGLRDHLDGGFFRYTVDPDWQTPHFEKMLYDNALLIRVYLRAAKVLQEPAFEDIARQALQFVLSQMRAAEGGYVAAFSAVDSDGVEGGYYLWEAETVRELAGADWSWVERYYALDKPSPFEAGHLLIPKQPLAALAQDIKQSESELSAGLKRLHERLLARRAKRELPIDTKVLAGWNGLLLTALVEAATQLKPQPGEPDYVRAAGELRDFILAHFVVQKGTGKNLSLVRAKADKESLGSASLEDYAYVSEGLLAWQQAYAKSGDRLIQALIDHAWQAFYIDGRWRHGQDRLLNWRVGDLAVGDGPMPAPPAVLMRVSRASGRQQANIDKALQRAQTRVEEQTFWYASYVGLYGGQASGSRKQESGGEGKVE